MFGMSRPCSRVPRTRAVREGAAVRCAREPPDRPFDGSSRPGDDAPGLFAGGPRLSESSARGRLMQALPCGLAGIVGLALAALDDGGGSPAEAQTQTKLGKPSGVMVGILDGGRQLSGC